MNKKLLAACLVVPAASVIYSQDNPNFVIFIADDVSWNDLGCYGNEEVKTPTIDKLSEDGLRFTNCYLTASSCSPSRNSILTGRYPHNTGAAELHSSPPIDMVSFPEILRENGYHTVHSGKWHQGDYAERGFTEISREYEKITNSGEGMWLSHVESRPLNKPFFMWFAALDAHRAWGENQFSGTHDPDSVEPPFYLVDAENTRKDMAQYYDEIHRFDFAISEVVKELREQNALDNTFIIVMADNGRPFPHSKTRVNDRGMKTPFIIHWPKGVNPEITSSLVSVIDIAPTILELAGCDIPESVQGKSFSSLLEDPDAKFRNYVFAEHNWHDYEAHERMVRNEKYMYIRNARPLLPQMGPADAVESPSMKDLKEQMAKGKLTEIQADVFVTPRPYEELYNCEEDPLQLLNIAAVPENQDALVEMREILNTWMDETGDNVPDDITKSWFLYEPGYIQTMYIDKRGEMPGKANNATKINNPGPF